MISFFRKWLSYRIAGAMALSLTLVTCVVTAGSYILIRRDAFQEKHALVDAMMYSLETTLADVPRATMQRVIENYGTIAGIKKIAIIDRHGQSLASTDRIDVDRPSTSTYVAAFLQSKSFSRTTHLTDDALVILEPLRGRAQSNDSQRDIVAIAEITLYLDAIEATATQRAETLLGVTMGGYVFLCAALGLMLHSWVTRPLSALALEAETLRQGKRSGTALAHGPDEVGRLALAFDAMATRIDEMVRGLEGEVVSRTADLQAERRALQREKDLLELLFHVTAIANEAASPENALSDALQKICTLIGSPAAIVFTVTGESQPMLQPTNIRYIAEATSWPDVLPTSKLARGQGVSGRALETAIAVVEVPIAAFPILVGSNVVGVMQFYVEKLDASDTRLLAAMETVGTELGRVIERNQVTRLKDDFVSTVSHELRTPLTAIRGSLGLLQHGVVGELSPDVLEMVTIANESCMRLVRLINDLLDVQKLSAGRIEIHRENIDVRGLLATIIAENWDMANSAKVRLILEPGPSFGSVSMDRDRFIQIVTNLVSNAVKFSPPETDVTLRAYATHDKVRVEVCDRGPGIPKEFRSSIFEQFAQGDASSTRKKDGSGLGLNIAKRLVELHGGVIGFEDREGGGTTFYFEVPAETSNSSANRPANS